MQRIQTLSSHFAPNPLSSPLQYHQFELTDTLKGKTIIVTGGSRGIGLAIAKRAAQDGANVAILAKTAKEDPRLPGTIYTAAKEIEEAGGKALPIQCDIRDEESVKRAIEKVVVTFGGIDILVNNASAVQLYNTLKLDMKRFDLMHSINCRGTYMMSKYCIPHLLKSENPKILTIAPPLVMNAKWFSQHCAYTIAKIGMSLCVLGMSEEFRDKGIAINALWPKTCIATTAIKNLLGGDDVIQKSRTAEIMGDAAQVILSANGNGITGEFLVDEDVLRSVGIEDFSKYKVNMNMKEEDLILCKPSQCVNVGKL